MKREVSEPEVAVAFILIVLLLVNALQCSRLERERVNSPKKVEVAE